ncbi:hypothetical protein [Mucilaginibacter sp. SP1R1]|uniref:hypothetical protein n=1 Tax=Mucilaginibacter sp. SP1R1 TaxID=2723091 RepID=UPI0016191DC6|nr:hypothetical protein [Mucilaginibacter sp. SP1R1]MBB6151401.1 hypothetical protein [Mucilaginibacter sp. SP1R1]
MKKELYLVICLLLFNGIIRAQNTGDIRPFKESFTSAPQPFLFSVNTLTGNTPFWSLNYSGSYGERASTPFGYNGVDQQFAVKGYLGNQFTLYANASVGFARDGGTTSAQQAELLHDFIGGKQLLGPRIGLSLGASRDWTNVKAIFSRVTASFDAASWKFAGNLRFEKAFDKSRDDIDLVTSLGFHHRIVGQFFGGVEAVGEDLEGFWEADEAEGGAKLLVGPSINYVPPGSRFAFSVCGGPIFYATHSNVIPSEAIRDLSTLAQNGYTIRAQISFNIH